MNERNITAEKINAIIGIKESYELPEKLMQLMLSEERERIFKKFLQLETDLSYDWFTDYFQENHSNRDKMMQDYTPKELCELIAQLGVNSEVRNIADICCGTGGLTINVWNNKKDAFFYCEELSMRAFPILLFNLAVRKINAIAVNKDVLSGEIFGIYKVNNGDIEILNELPNFGQFDLCVTNPPYSVKYKFDASKTYNYGIPPNNYADFGFIEYCLEISKKVIAILPHGVLFRGGKEQAIRKNLIKQHKLKAVIGLPDKLFLNTTIPVAILIFENNSENILFIDASKEFKKISQQNKLLEEHIEKIKTIYQENKELQKYSHKTSFSEVEENDYNLNIPRYVDTFEDEIPININEVINELAKLENEIKGTEKELVLLLNDMCGAEDDMQSILNLKQLWGKS